MSRKFYIEIAALFADTEPTDDILKIAQGLAEIMARDNPRFDRARFMHAMRFAVPS